MYIEANYNNHSSDEENAGPSNIFLTEENLSELVYVDLLEHLMKMVITIKNLEGNWREHLKLVQNFEQTIHLFYLPEIHTTLVPILLEFQIQGSTLLRAATSKLIARII